MNPNQRLMATLGVTLLLGTAAYSQMDSAGLSGTGGSDPVPESSGPGPSEPRQTGAENSEAKGIQKDTSLNITESIEEWEKVEGVGPEGAWSMSRDIFKPGKSAIAASAAAPPRTQAQDAGDLSGETIRLPVLHGVMIGSDDDRVAILGQDMVREGNYCEGFTVRSIEPGKVTLSRDGKEYDLYVKE